ncbi:MAG: hypothetical protein AAGE84_00900 [Cyanobacteria bacterium P01_G01_bin.39]
MSRLKIAELDFVELVPINQDNFQKVIGGVSTFDADFDVDFDAELSVEQQGNDTVVFVGRSFAEADALSFGGKARARARARQS